MSDAAVGDRRGEGIRPLVRTRRVPISELLALRFHTPALEVGFSQYYLPISLFQSRLAFGLACAFLLSDYIADGLFYGLFASPANLMRIAVVAPAFLCFFIASYSPATQRRYELYVAIFYAVVSSFLCVVLYRLDKAGGNGLSNIVGFLNLVFLLAFGFVLIGVRFHLSLVACIVVSSVFISLLYQKFGAVSLLYYLLYQIFTVFILFALLGYTRELVLRLDFAAGVELAEAREALERRNRNDARHLAWLRQLAQFLRHEVRQPIAQINSSIEVAQLASRNGPGLEPYLSSAALGARHVWNLIERASRATDAEAFVRQAQPQSVDLSALLAEQVAAFARSHSGIAVALQSPPSITVNVDLTLMKEAIGNLLTNAASFADEGSTVRVEAAPDGRRVTIAVTNKGPPIEGDPEAMFGPFASTRADALSEHQGLGLYLVRLIAERHGGSAALANLADRSGVTASITLPLAG